MPANPLQSVRDAGQARLTGLILKVIRGAMVGIVYSLEAKDEYSRQHSGRVAEMSRRFSELLGHDKIRTEQIFLAASVHDIGKIGIPDAVLLCPGRLSDEQWQVMQSHPKVGADILTKTAETLREEIRGDMTSLPIPRELVEQVEEIRGGILHHHERWDGRGYPDHLAGEEIPFISRLIALCDSTDAMMSKRVYRDALSADVCMEEIWKNSGVMYDPALAESFLAHFGAITEGMFPVMPE